MEEQDFENYCLQVKKYIDSLEQRIRELEENIPSFKPDNENQPFIYWCDPWNC